MASRRSAGYASAQRLGPRCAGPPVGRCGRLPAASSHMTRARASVGDDLAGVDARGLAAATSGAGDAPVAVPLGDGCAGRGSLPYAPRAGADPMPLTAVW